MRRIICKWIKNPCCGWQGWLFRMLGCAEFEPQPKPVFLTVKVCDDSGLLAHEGCPVSYNRSFIPDSAPVEYCRRHKRLRKYGRKGD